MTLDARPTRPSHLIIVAIVVTFVLSATASGRIRAEGVAAEGAAPVGQGPVIEPGISEAIEKDGTAIVHLVLKGHRELPFKPTPADENRYRSDVAAAHRALRSTLNGNGVRILHEHDWAFG